ncbi:MAG: helix-turn-helix transcriptional regulator [Nocardiopsaceae bacterium]|nr:helix-turn-helix transcriptional regulator [Nocardiopsaceae bacterium]
MNHAEKPTVTEEGRKKMGQHLRALRKRRGWTQEDLCEKSGVSVPTIRAIERDYPPGRRRSKATLMALSRTFGLPDDHLSDYLLNPRPEEPPGAGPEDLRPLAPGPTEERLTEIIDARLNKIIVPRLDTIDRQIRVLVDAFGPAEAVEVDIRHDE